MNLLKMDMNQKNFGKDFSHTTLLTYIWYFPQIRTLWAGHL